jgi:hypothetical protein
MTDQTIAATFGSAEEARAAVRALELEGIDPSHINLDTPPVDDLESMSAVDSASVRRPAKRYFFGAAGAAIAVALVVLALDTAIGIDPPILLPAVIVAFLCGGLIGLYSKLSMHRDLPQADAPGPVQIRVPDADHRRAHDSVLN